jgi:uncharacterized membrane protein YheB (UPF0754 family)
MIWLIPLLNALFGWTIVSLLFWFLFHPYQSKNFFIFEMHGFIPKNLSSWGKQLGVYISENVVNIPKMKDSLLKSEKLQQIHVMLEAKVDDFLRHKLKEKIPVFSMFITEGLISKMKEILVEELAGLVPSVIEQIASGMEEQFNISKMIDERLSGIATPELESLFHRYTGKAITALKITVGVMGFALGCIEILLSK